MNLGARHGVLKEQNIGKAALEGRANEIYDLLMANILSGTGGGSAGGSGGAGRSRVQHDTDRSAMVCAVDAPDEDADGVAGCFADSGADCVASSSASGTTGGGANEGVGGFVEDHAGDAGMCLSMHQPWASLGGTSPPLSCFLPSLDVPLSLGVIFLLLSAYVRCSRLCCEKARAREELGGNGFLIPCPMCACYRLCSGVRREAD